MNRKKRIVCLCMTVLLMMCLAGVSLAHSGRTDGQGGHKDNQNASGLGSYHYHCGGNPPHLHSGGVCPYKSGSTSSATKAPAPKATSQPAVAAVTFSPESILIASVWDDDTSVRYGVTNIKDVNVREDASTKTARVDVLREKGTMVAVVETRTVSNETWHRIQLDKGGKDAYGYVLGDFIDMVE